MAGKNMRGQVEALAEEIRNLRAELDIVRAAQALHHCGGCHCVHTTWTVPTWQPWVSNPITITVGTPADIGTGGIVSTVGDTLGLAFTSHRNTN